MTGPHRDVFRIGTCSYPQRDECMPQFVELQTLKPDSCCCRLPPTSPKTCSSQRSSFWPRKDQCIGGSEDVLVKVPLEFDNNPSRQRNRSPGALRFRRTKNQPTVRFHQRFSNNDPTSEQIDTGSPEPRHLTEAKAAVGR